MNSESLISAREKFRGSEHFFWDYILNTRRANELRIDHKKIQKDPFFPFFWEIVQSVFFPRNDFPIKPPPVRSIYLFCRFDSNHLLQKVQQVADSNRNGKEVLLLCFTWHGNYFAVIFQNKVFFLKTNSLCIHTDNDGIHRLQNTRYNMDGNWHMCWVTCVGVCCVSMCLGRVMFRIQNSFLLSVFHG